MPIDDPHIRHVPWIASYHGDFCWLKPALKSHKLYGRDWEPPVVCTDSADAEGARQICREVFPEARVVVLDGDPGYMRAQVSMMSCDMLVERGDYFWLWGSDTMLTGPLSPMDMWSHDYARPVMLYTPHASLGKVTAHWKRGTEAALGYGNVENEFMRRLPLGYPRTLYPRVRARLEQVHGRTWSDYVYSTCPKGTRGYGTCSFSESNVMGAFAWQEMRSIYAWVNTDTVQLPDLPVRQLWSHGGYDHVDPREGKRQGDLLRGWGLL